MGGKELKELSAYIYIPRSYKKKRKKEKKNIPRSLPDFYIYFRGQKLGRSMSP
jgi:hypothetical protein